MQDFDSDSLKPKKGLLRILMLLNLRDANILVDYSNLKLLWKKNHSDCDISVFSCGYN